jgi:hypothetical protein
MSEWSDDGLVYCTSFENLLGERFEVRNYPDPTRLVACRSRPHGSEDVEVWPHRTPIPHLICTNSIAATLVAMAITSSRSNTKLIPRTRT